MNIDIYKDAIQNIWIHTLRYVVPVLCGCIVLIAFALYGAIKKLFDKAAVICLIAVNKLRKAIDKFVSFFKNEFVKRFSISYVKKIGSKLKEFFN